MELSKQNQSYIKQTTSTLLLFFIQSFLKELDNNFNLIQIQSSTKSLSFTMQSNVGNSQVYNDGDQKNSSKAEVEQEKKDARFHEGKEHSHKANDSSSYIAFQLVKNRLLT